MQLTKKTIIISLCSILFSCAIGKDYKRPEVAKIEAFKESKDWKIAKPKENEIKSKWWEVYNDPELNKLEEQVEISNQNIKAAEAAYRQARAVVSENRAAYFPSITGNAATNRNAVANNVVNKYSVNLDAAWEIDVWGRIRRSVESSFALSKASQADLAAAKLSAQSELAINYFSLKIADKQKFLLEDTVKNYQKSLQLNENLYKSGVAPKSDLLQAKTQLETAMAQSIDIDNTRAKLEHAIALLIGKAPAELSLVVSDKIPEIPEIPLGLPSELLERRPDVAAAEQRMISANANIGVAKAAFFPKLELTGSGGYESSSFSNLIAFPNRIWSIGPNIAQTIFDAGLRRAQTKAAIASYDQTVANYRQSILNSFVEVEDNLAAIRILTAESKVQQSVVKDSSETSKIFNNQYKAGIVSYLNVVTAQNTELSSKISELNTRKSLLTASVNLIKALGGGWKL